MYLLLGMLLINLYSDQILRISLVRMFIGLYAFLMFIYYGSGKWQHQYWLAFPQIVWCNYLLIYLFQVQYKEAEGSSFRDGSYGETPGTPKVRNLVFILVLPPLLLSLFVCDCPSIPFCYPNHEFVIWKLLTAFTSCWGSGPNICSRFNEFRR